MAKGNIANIKMHNTKSKAKSPCRCLTCSRPHRESFEGKTLLICGDEACDLKCEVCTERPISGCGFKPGAKVDGEIREEVPA